MSDRRDAAYTALQRRLDSVRSAVQSALAETPIEFYALTTTEREGWAELRLVPKDNQAASVLLSLDVNTLTLECGRDSVVEIVAQEADYSGPWRERLDGLLHAVVEGRFEEQLRLRGDRTVSSRGTFRAPDGAETTSHQFRAIAGRPFSGTEVKVVHWSAYGPSRSTSR